MGRVYIIAEAGVNHNGDIETAKMLIEQAAIAGADAVKFQTFQASKLLVENTEKAEYQKKSTDSSESQYEMIKKLELSESNHKDLIKYCRTLNIEFLSSAFDLDSINLLHDLGIKTWKIPSGEITNLPYLRKIARFKERVILSTGMCEMNEIEDALNVLKKNNCNDITILHCNTEYPTPMVDVNLLAMLTIKEKFQLPIGYSDHTCGIEVAIAAVALGAGVIEKHFTLDKTMPGPDHAASLSPKELSNMVKSIRNIETALGSSVKKPSESEIKNIKIARKSLVASKDINVGDIFSLENVTSKRPGTGVSPMKWDLIEGRIANKKINKDEQIEL